MALLSRHFNFVVRIACRASDNKIPLFFTNQRFCHRKHSLSQTTGFGSKTPSSAASQTVRFSTYAENSGFTDEANLYKTTIYGFQIAHSDNLCFIFAISADREQF